MRRLVLSFLLPLAAVCQTTYEIGTTPFITYGAIDGCPVVQTINGNPFTPWYYVAGQNGAGSTIGEGAHRFGVTGSGGSGSITLSFLTYQNGNALALFEDPTSTSDGTLKATSGALAFDGTFKSVSFSGLDPNHYYEVLEYLIPSGGANANGIASVTITGGTLSTTPTFTRSCGAMYGDSIVAYSYVSTLGSVDIREGYYPAFLATGMSLERMGAGGQKVVTWGELSTSAITSSTPTLPTVVVHELGVNDQQAYVNAGSITTFQSGVVTELQNMAVGVPTNSVMLWQQILPNTATNNGQRSAYNAAIVSAQTTYNASPVNGVSSCSYNTDYWINPATDAPGDGLHPYLSNAPSALYPFGNPLYGYGKIANNMSFILAGYSSSFGRSFNLTGPSYGTSATFTISPAVAGATFPALVANGGTSDWVVVPSDGGAGGTFTPTTVTLTGGTSSATFSYTPPSTGAVYITLTSLPSCAVAPPRLAFSKNPPSFILIGKSGN